MLKARLREIASSPALRDWARACPTAAFIGICRVETKHAIYLFRSGHCYAATGKGAASKGPSTELVGMNLVGWLLAENVNPPAPPTADVGRDPRSEATTIKHPRPGQPMAQSGTRRIPDEKVHVSRTFRPGARAVLTSKGKIFTGPRTALTSPVTAFTHLNEGSSKPRPPESKTLTAASLTRIHRAAANE